MPNAATTQEWHVGAGSIEHQATSMPKVGPIVRRLRSSTVANLDRRASNSSASRLRVGACLSLFVDFGISKPNRTTAAMADVQQAAWALLPDLTPNAPPPYSTTSLG